MLLHYDAIPLCNNSILNYFHSCSLFSSYLVIYNMQQCALLRVLNQVCASHRPARTWFLRIVSVQMYACVCVCVSASDAINNGVMWSDIDVLNKFCGFYMAAVVSIVSGHGVSIHTRRGN